MKPLLTAVLAIVLSGSASAAPLDELLDAARTQALAPEVERQRRLESEARVEEARARLLPSARLALGYTRNEVEVAAEFPASSGTGFERAIIQAQDQVDGSVRLDIPVLDLVNLVALEQAERTETAAEARVELSQRAVCDEVLLAYFALVEARAVRMAAVRKQDTANERAQVALAKLQAGTGAEVEVARARTDAASAAEAIAKAEYDAAVAERDLFVRTGVRVGELPPLDTDLEPEPALERWFGSLQGTPDVKVAQADADALLVGEDAATMAYVPTVEAFASERYTNSAGFGPEFVWAAGVSLAWRIGFAEPASVATASRSVERALTEVALAQQRAETEVVRAWHAVASAITRSRAAEVASEANQVAVKAARARYEAGTGTHLELSQAERDLFDAEVAEIRSLAAVNSARLRLRLVAGLPVERRSIP
jgi:outer membrane protein